jgi:hypothetical protein
VLAAGAVFARTGTPPESRLNIQLPPRLFRDPIPAEIVIAVLSV